MTTHDDHELSLLDIDSGMSYEELRAAWSWERAEAALDGLPGGLGLNMAHEMVDRHTRAGRGDVPAFILLNGERRRLVSYSELEVLSNRVANVLTDLGIGTGDRVFGLMGRRLELYTTALGALKTGAVFCPLFSSFGPEPVRARLDLGNAKALVTTDLLYRRKVESIRNLVSSLEHVLLVGTSGTETVFETPADALDFQGLADAAGDRFEIGETDPDAPALLHFTSGTTGTPKGALHVHRAIVAHNATARVALDLRPSDVYWCTADPGWVTGISYGLVAPLTAGASAVVDEQEFEAARWYQILAGERVNVWYTAPTAIRMLRRVGSEAARGYSFDALRHMASVGEPLEPEAVLWGVETFGRPFHDTWWQTETGAIMLANLPGTEVRPGSMGRPLPGVDAATVLRHESEIEILDDDSKVGELALRIGWPSMFRDYLGDPERYRHCFLDDWYLSGDLVRRDDEGYFWFVGRADDAIQSAGHLIGPFEIESVLMEHPAVADAAAFGKADPVAFEIVCAAVVLQKGREASEELRAELVGHARRRLGPAVAPREITFQPELPKTPSGKKMRRALRGERG
jgi:acetyl-CoA synthetase